MKKTYSYLHPDGDKPLIQGSGCLGRIRIRNLKRLNPDPFLFFYKRSDPGFFSREGYGSPSFASATLLNNCKREFSSYTSASLSKKGRLKHLQ